ncbi:hypothetical protein [Bradyrhizobium uaiense]|uniref:Uncharacterized protein n=1 Tax=Bradyrhizobium uaiense TaxID=2594946 RepID=A0A6P1B8I9_9BRAD|nr:hypothetical protein [Bradyrhizobium uaiense]NEU94808.1 hypothetical protein [Bradyrhizobium uaiense]
MTNYYGYGFPANFRNLIDGGDFTVNPWQRGTAFTGIANTLTYTADRWFAVGGAASSISVSRAAVSAVLGFAQALQFGRAAANTNTAVISLGQVLESADVYRLQGKQVTLSFWALAGANWSPVNGNLNVQLNTGTGVNEGSASMIAGTWAGYQSRQLLPNQSVAPAAGSNIAQPIAATWKQYSFTGVVPTNASELGIQLNATPVGTAGAADYIQIMGVQLELGSAASVFEARDIQVETEICQRYAWVTPEPAAGVIVGSGMNTGAATQVFYMATPVQMFKAPTVTVTAGTFKTNQAGTATATAITAGTTHTVNAISINGNSAGTAGQGTLLQGGGGAGSIVASADL